MKKELIAITILFILLMAGCGKSKVIISDVADNKCDDNSYFNGDTSIVESEKGYYILRHTFNGFYLTYKSKDRDDEIFLCNKPECKHIHADVNEPTRYNEMYEDCNSYLGKECILNSIKIYDGEIYVLMYEDGEAVLYRISKDGSVRNKLFSLGEISGNHSGVYNYIVNNNSVYVLYFSEKYTSGEPSQISQWSIDSGEKKILYEDGEHALFRMMLYNGGLFLRRCDTKTGYDSQICRLDIKSGKIEEIAGEHASQYTIDNNSNVIYYWDMGKGLFKYDLSTGKEQLVRESDSSMLNAYIACNQKYICLDNRLGNYYRLDTEAAQNPETFIEIIDLQTGNIAGKVETSDEFDIDCNCDNENIICSDGKNYIYIKFEDVVN